MSLRERLAGYDFYHVIPLGDGLETPGVRRYIPYQEPVTRLLERVPMKGRRVLDVGCRDGLFSFQAERLGAAEVVGIDNNLSRGALELLIPHLGSRVVMREKNLLDLTPEDFGLFDLVICSGVLYHLRYPFWGLRRLRDVLVEGGLLVLETAVLHDSNRSALLHCPSPRHSPCDPTSVSFFNPLGLTDTLQSLGLDLEHQSLLYPRRTMAAQAAWQWLRGLAGLKSRRVVNRGVFAARRRPVSTARLMAYWEGTHSTGGWN